MLVFALMSGVGCAPSPQAQVRFRPTPGFGLFAGYGMVPSRNPPRDHTPRLLTDPASRLPASGGQDHTPPPFGPRCRWYHNLPGKSWNPAAQAFVPSMARVFFFPNWKRKPRNARRFRSPERCPPIRDRPSKILLVPTAGPGVCLSPLSPIAPRSISRPVSFSLTLFMTTFCVFFLWEAGPQAARCEEVLRIKPRKRLRP